MRVNPNTLKYNYYIISNHEKVTRLKWPGGAFQFPYQKSAFAIYTEIYVSEHPVSSAASLLSK
jgi:hypothetical protein